MKSGNRLWRALCLALLVFGSYAHIAKAGLVEFGITLTVTHTDLAPPPTCNVGFDVFGCDVAAGDKFFGSFVVDQSYLNVDATHIDIPTANFYLLLGELLFPQGMFPTLGEQLLGGDRGIFTVDIQHGTITQIYGGVLGSQDQFRIFFSLAGIPATFEAWDTTFSSTGEAEVDGRFRVQRVPEPPILGLVGIGLLLALGRLRHRRPLQ